MRPELCLRGKWTTSTTAGATLSAVIARELTGAGAVLTTPLVGARSGNCWLRRGRTIGCIDGEGKLVVGRVLSTWQGWTAVNGWEALGEITGCRWSARTACGLAPLGLADCWRERYDGDIREVVATAACFPLDVTEGLHTDDWQHWRVGDSTLWLQEWCKHATRAAEGSNACGMHRADMDDDDTAVWHGTYGTRAAGAMAPWVDCTTPAPIKMHAGSDTACTAMVFTSDGSVEDAGSELASGAFGWVARDDSVTDGWGDFSTLLAGAGRIMGEWNSMTSTRAEAAGLLDAMRAAGQLARVRGALRRAVFLLDNEAVVKQCATLLQWSSLRWLKCSDRDVWRCLAF